jgi:hypothetical protein
MVYLTGMPIQGSEEAVQVCTQEQRRVKPAVCRLLLAHHMVNLGLLDTQAAARVVAHKGGCVKRIKK